MSSYVAGKLASPYSTRRPWLGLTQPSPRAVGASLTPPTPLHSGLSSREANATLVAEVEKTRGSTVTLVDPDPTNTSSSSHAKGAAATAATRTYDFGDRHVYGSDANQSMIYMDVAKPILEQVLQGYNCTIFAYGQTGTGKT